MSVGFVAVLFGLTAFTIVYAIYGTAKAIPAEDLEADYAGVGVVPIDPNDRGMFERIVRPMVRNIVPQTPLSAQLKARHSSKTIELLVRSGNPWNIQPEEFFGLRILAGLAGLMGTILLVLSDSLPADLPWYAWLALGTGLGAFTPKVLLDGHKGRRLKDARRGLPEALDLLVITLKSGQNFTPALGEVVERLPEGVVKVELGRVSTDLRAGRTLADSLVDFARRAPSDEVEAFAKAVMISQRLGSDVSETLQSQAESARAAYEAALDEKIGKLPTTLFFPILGLMLPALFIVLLAPAFSNIAKAFA